MRDYIQPKIPSAWTGQERTFANMLISVLDDLHMPITEEWLSTRLRDALTSAGKSSKDYDEESDDTGISWIDGSPILRTTLEIEVTANTAAESESIKNLNALIRVEGFVMTSAGACYPVGSGNGSIEVNVWKNAGSDKIKVLSGASGTAYITAYYTQGEAPVTQDTFVFFNDGYVKPEGGSENIAWATSDDATPIFARPSDSSHGYTTDGHATLDSVETNGYLLLYCSSGSNYFYNSYVCTEQPVHIPASAEKLNVKGAKGPNGCQISIALLPGNAPNSMDASNGGKVSTFYTLTSVPTDYSLPLEEAMKGSDDYRILINFRGKGDLYRKAQITRVYFE